MRGRPKALLQPGLRGHGRMIEQQAVIDAFYNAKADAILAGPIVTRHTCDCNYCDVETEETHYSPDSDALMVVWSDLHTLAMSRRFDGLLLLPEVESLIAFAEMAQGTRMDQTRDEVTAGMLASLDGIVTALSGATVNPSASAPR